MTEPLVVDLRELEVKNRTADGKGRVTLGAQYAGEDVKVAIVRDA